MALKVIMGSLINIIINAETAGAVGGFNRTSTAAGLLGDRMTTTQRCMNATNATARTLQSTFAGMAAGMGISELVRMSDQYTKYTAQLHLATGSTAEFNQANQEVERIAKATQGGLEPIGVLYARIASSSRELGTSQQDVARITETVGLSLKVAGASSQETASTMLQLSQSFASGRLNGQEFAAVMESAPGLMQILADSMGVPKGALKKLSEEGKITAEMMTDAFTNESMLTGLRSQAKQIQTISGAYTLLHDEAMKFVGVQAQSSGAVSAITSGIGLLASNLDVLASASAGFVAAKLAQAVLSAGVAATASVQQSIAAAQATNFQRTASIAYAEATVAESAAVSGRLVATQAALVASREEAMAKMASGNSSIAAASAAMAHTQATMASAAAQLDAARAAGAQSYALALVRESQAILGAQNMNLLRQEAALTAATEARSVATAELALLGQQQARVSAQITAAAAAQTAAQGALTAATSTGTAAAGLGTAAMTALGGPIGLITLALGAGAAAWMYWGSTAKANAEQVEKSVFETSKSIVETLDAQIKRIDERNAALAYKPDLKENASTEAIGALQQKINQLQSLKTNSDQEETVRLVEINKLLAARGQIEQRVAEFSQKSEEERSRRAKAAAGVAAQEILQKQSGVPKSYLTDLKTLKDAWDTGAMSQEVYVKAVSQLANETYKASTAGKEAAKGASAEAKANKAGARAGAAVDRDSMAEQIAAYKNTDKAILDSRQDFYTAMGYAAQMGEKTSLEAITQGLDQEFEVWMQRSALINAELELLKKKKNSQKEQEDARGRLAALERDYEQAQLKGAGEVAVILRQQSVAFVEAEASAKSYLDTLNLQYSRELAGVGQGTKTRDRASAVAQITDRYDQQAQQVESDQRRGAFKDNPQQYQRELERIKRYQREALSSYNAYYDAMQAKQGSWELGAREGIANYFEQSQTVFQQTEALVGNAFKGMEDGLMQFVTTGKGGFKALADSLIADMIRIALKQAVLGPLMNAVGSFLPGMGSAAAASSAGTSSSIATMIATPTFAAKGHAFDAGGLVPFARGGVFNSPTAFGFGGGKLGVLGEAGPEAIMPLTRGPDGKLGLAGGGGGGGSSTVSVVINNNSAEKATASETVDSRGGRRIEVTIGELVAAELRRPGSASNNAMRSAFGSAPALVGR